MARYFNTEGCCNPDDHYMVRLDDRLEKIKKQFVDRKKYFVINRGRQYGKTTTLMALTEYLKEDYIVLAMDFQMMSTANFANEHIFVVKFAEYVEKLFLRKQKLMEEIDEDVFHSLVSLKFRNDISMDTLFDRLSAICETSEKPVVMIIDEVDSASDNQVFLDFLAQLRGYYLDRVNRPIFHSVILAGVYDIKNLRLKIHLDEKHKYNSPWNIAAEFKVSMNFSAGQIAVMLEEYEADHHTGMNLEIIAEEIFQYTSGYPYLVSAICKYLDEEIPYKKGFEKMINVWSKEGVAESAKILLNESIPLFGSLIQHISEYQDLKNMLYTILFQGERIAYNPDNKTIEMACMFGYTVNQNGGVEIANRIFETRLYNFFLSEEELTSAVSKAAKQERNRFISNGRFDMELILEKFVRHFNDIYGENDEKFVEIYGRKFFMLYLKPIINGIGNYYIEAQTRDARRTDIIVDYLGEQYIVELKIWHGNEYNERGEQQLAEYLEYYHLDKGYMLSFNFNKKKTTGINEIKLGDKIIVEAVV